MDLRKQAKGRECQIRIPCICNGDSETVVLCHSNNKRLFGVGMGQKVPDMFGAWGCNECHNAVDSREWLGGDYTEEEIQIMFYEGCFRTMNELLKEGLIRIP